MPAMKTSPDEAIATLTRHEIDPAFVMRVSLLMNWLQPAHAGTILDVGCGRGFYSEAVARVYPQATTVGVDYNEKPLTLAREQAHAALVSLARSDARALPFPATSFDAVICPDVLEHIVEHDVVLSEVNRVLKDDGLLLITVPHQNYPFVWDPINWVLERAFGIHMPTHIWWLAGIWADHVRLYTTEELTRAVTEAGFTIEERGSRLITAFPSRSCSSGSAATSSSIRYAPPSIATAKHWERRAGSCGHGDCSMRFTTPNRHVLPTFLPRALFSRRGSGKSHPIPAVDRNCEC